MSSEPVSELDLQFKKNQRILMPQAIDFARHGLLRLNQHHGDRPKPNNPPTDMRSQAQQTVTNTHVTAKDLNKYAADTPMILALSPRQAEGLNFLRPRPVAERRRQSAAELQLQRVSSISSMTAGFPIESKRELQKFFSKLTHEEVQNLKNLLQRIPTALRPSFLCQIDKINRSGALQLDIGGPIPKMSMAMVHALSEPDAIDQLIAAAPKDAHGHALRLDDGRLYLSSLLSEPEASSHASTLQHGDFVRAFLTSDAAGRARGSAIVGGLYENVPPFARETIAIEVMSSHDSAHDIRLEVLAALVGEAHAAASFNISSFGGDVYKAMCRSNLVRSLQALPSANQVSLLTLWCRELASMQSVELWNGLCLTNFVPFKKMILEAVAAAHPMQLQAIMQGQFDSSDVTHRHVAFFSLLKYSKIESFFQPLNFLGTSRFDWKMDTWRRVCSNPLYRYYSFATQLQYPVWFATLQAKPASFWKKAATVNSSYYGEFFAAYADLLRTWFIADPSDRTHLARVLARHCTDNRIAKALNLSDDEMLSLAESELFRAPSFSASAIVPTSSFADYKRAISIYVASLVAGAEPSSLIEGAIGLSAENVDGQHHKSLLALCLAAHPYSGLEMSQRLPFRPATDDKILHPFLQAFYGDGLNPAVEGAPPKGSPSATKEGLLLYETLKKVLQLPEHYLTHLAALVDEWPVETERLAAAQSFGAIILCAYLLDSKELLPWLMQDRGFGSQLRQDLLQVRAHKDRGALAASILPLCASAEARAILTARPRLRNEKTAEARLVGVVLALLEMEGFEVEPIRASLNHSMSNPLVYAPRQRLFLSFLHDLLHDTSLSFKVKQRVLDQLGAAGTGKLLYAKVLDGLVLRGLDAMDRMAETGALIDLLAKACIAEHLGELAIDDASTKYAETFGKSRASQAAWVYLAGLKRLGNKQVEEAFGRYLTQVMNQTFDQHRAEISGNVHLEALEKQRPGFYAKYRAALPAKIVTSSSKKQTIIEKLWLYEKIVSHRHFVSNAPVHSHLIFCLSPNASEEDVAAARATILKMHRLNPTLDTEVACSCIALLDAVDVKQTAAAMMRLKEALEQFSPRPELHADLKSRISGGHDDQKQATGLIVDSSDPIDLLMCGTDVAGSCQRVNGTPHLNCGLLGYLLNGQTRLLAVKNISSGKILARRMIRALTDGTRPVLFVEPLYGDSRFDSAIVEFAQQKARASSAEIYQMPPVGGVGTGPVMHSLGGRAPFEYCDGAYAHKLAANSKFTIRATVPLLDLESSESL